ncbi:MAG: sulfatase-like hydrolase/transferase [Opitutales bacterium]|nr:sulfatase-like hydrolase/transferase [Opitutales bacterium]
MKLLCPASLLFLTTALLASERPNFLFIFADDQSYEAIAAHGNEEVYTPNLDRLAESGVSFMNAYNMGGWTGAVCVPARTMMVTGRTVWRARDSEAHLDEYAKREELWPQLLGQAGYETYFTGKWHVKVEPEAVFDHQVNERPGMPLDSWISMLHAGGSPTLESIRSFPDYNRPMKNEPDAWSPYARSFGGFWEGGKHWSEVLTDDATAFLEHASASDKPFFMYLAFNAPHDPRQSPKRFVDMYPVEQIKVPASYLPEYPYKDAIGCTPLLRDEALAPFPRTEYAVKVHRQEYYAIITHMDEQIGHILEALEKTGKRDNTYIVFAADHGLACGNHGFLGKQNMYDHSMKVPLIVVGPDVPENEKREALVYLQDIMATTLDLAGMDKPAYVEFNSLMPLIANPQAKSAYDAIYGCYLATKQRMIRVGDMKLIVYPEAKRIRLFNLRLDPQEIDDLSSNPAEWPTVHHLFAKLIEKQEQMADDLDLLAFFPELTESIP